MGAEIATTMKAAAKPAKKAQLEAKLSIASREKQLADDQLQAMLNRIAYLQCEEVKLERGIQNARKKAEALLASKVQRVHAKSGSSDTAQAVVEVLDVLHDNDTSVRKGQTGLKSIALLTSRKETASKAAARVKESTKQDVSPSQGDQNQAQLEAAKVQSSTTTCSQSVLAQSPAASSKPSSAAKVLQGDLSCMGVRKASRQMSTVNSKPIHLFRDSTSNLPGSCQSNPTAASTQDVNGREHDADDTISQTLQPYLSSDVIPANGTTPQPESQPGQVHNEASHSGHAEQATGDLGCEPASQPENEDADLIPDEVVECSQKDHSQERNNKLALLSSSCQQHDVAVSQFQNVNQVASSNTMQQLQAPKQVPNKSRNHEHATSSSVSRVISLKSTATATAPAQVVLAGGVGWGLRPSSTNHLPSAPCMSNSSQGGCSVQSASCAENSSINNHSLSSTTLCSRATVSRDGSSTERNHRGSDCASETMGSTLSSGTRPPASQCSSRSSRPSSCSGSKASTSNKSAASSAQLRAGNSAPVSRASSIKTANMLPKRPSSSRPLSRDNAEQQQPEEPDMALKQQIWKLRRAFGLESAVLKDTSACVEVVGAGAWQ